MAIFTGRQFLDDWQAQVEAQIQTNTEGLISGTLVQQALIGLKNSTVDDEAVLAGSTTESFTIDENWVNVSDALLAGPQMYSFIVGGDAEFLIVDRALGTITGTSTAGYTYNGIAAIGVDAPQNVVVEASIGLNGVPNTAFVGSIVGTGGTREQSMYVERYNLTAPASAVYSLMIRAPAGSTSITVTPRSFGVAIKPTNNP